ncbi:hypothetical protein JL108_15515 [Aeromicrobium sp. YIM 150415]|uniref:hypothetical protein n=1 Tax=Aeromicrobium sp. YIM 150415 TaxID=2803912 RepID=UPI001965BFF3|nr:hypothetical protein [Aeromicrobium sp. YIM 150415]MBM9464859.1 hypothetical protein [Aeromicrobium sp. YIM 150415]
MRKLLTALLATLALLFVSACGSDDSGSGSSGEVGEDKGVELTQDNFAEEMSKAVVKAGTAHLSMEVDVAGTPLTVEGDTLTAEDPADAAVAMSMDMEAAGAPEGTKMDMRMVDQVMYMNMGQMTGDKFFKIDLTDESNPLGAQYNQLVNQSNPAAQFDAMDDAISSFEEDGDGGEIDGVETKKYTMTLDAAAMLEAQGMDTVGAPESLDYVLYIGVDNLPRRMEIEVPGAGTSTIDWTKWGEDVSIEAPAEDEISDENPFAGMAGS